MKCIAPTDTSSALIYITEGDSDEHLQILDGGVIKQLLDDKWKTFARVGYKDFSNGDGNSVLFGFHFLKKLFALKIETFLEKNSANVINCAGYVSELHTPY